MGFMGGQKLLLPLQSSKPPFRTAINMNCTKISQCKKKKSATAYKTLPKLYIFSIVIEGKKVINESEYSLTLC